ncbi:DUF3039 domain-containing protein [Nocardioides pinisoli]|uniref:DUF3039 domain-containing protein n=1 Tax=Nocardioides pinisoli TaxID=2950279 RepID=A0ABT1KYP6_9ACTN|nr:DUF3039 domain-containing protein [Nocardioides pinisoli]MCP3422727.1 DUF3039 domain-containing protein [Nocardioides pinisoli]
MNSDGRPTMRCLKDDLPNDWEDASDHAAAVQGRPEKPLPEFAHPIIRKAAADFPASSGDAETARESISGLSDPVWWKVKIGARWRGAVWEDPDTGQAWLCAAGYRREGEATDFYKEFMATVAAKGASAFLPTDEDREQLDREMRAVRLDAWSYTIQADARGIALELWGAELGESSFEILHPTIEDLAIARVTLAISTESIDDVTVVDVVVSVECLDYAHFPLVQWSELVVLSAIDGREQAWRSLPVAGMPTHSLVLEGAEADAAHDAMGRGAAPGVFDPGDTAHFAHRGRLVESMVEGEGVKALCGSFFVPRQDHKDMPKCPHCSAIHNALPD